MKHTARHRGKHDFTVGQTMWGIAWRTEKPKKPMVVRGTITRTTKMTYDVEYEIDEVVNPDEIVGFFSTVAEAFKMAFLCIAVLRFDYMPGAGRKWGEAVHWLYLLESAALNKPCDVEIEGWQLAQTGGDWATA